MTTCKWRCLEQCPYRDAKKQKHRPHAREKGEAEILRHPNNASAALSEKSDFQKCRWRATMCVKPAHKCPGERNHREAAEADLSIKGGREATGPVEAEGQRPTPLLARGVQTESSQEAKTPE